MAITQDQFKSLEVGKHAIKDANGSIWRVTSARNDEFGELNIYVRSPDYEGLERLRWINGKILEDEMASLIFMNESNSDVITLGIDSQDMEVGQTYEHNDVKSRYKITGFVMSTDTYEDDGHIATDVQYEQLADGLFPAGTTWTKKVPLFLKHFSLVL